MNLVAMDHKNPREKRDLKVDLLRRMLGQNLIIPNDIPVEDIQEDWFCHRETDTAKQLISELDSNSKCPLEYSPGPEDEVWLLDRGDTEDFIEDLRETPWYEL